MTGRRYLRLMLLCLSLVATSTALPRDALIVGIVPQFPPEQIFQTWSPVLDALTESTGETFELRIFQSIPDFEAAFVKGELDVAYMNPYHVVMANAAQGYVPLIRDGKRKLSGVLVVRRDSDVRDVRQLDGATVAFPSPNAFGASLYMRALLQEREGIAIKPIYVKTHTNVYRHVVTGQTAAGGGVRRTLDREPESLRVQLRVLYETPKTYPHPIVAHPRIPQQLRDSIQRGLLELADRPATAALLEGVQIPNPTPATLADYAELTALGLERFVVQPD